MVEALLDEVLDELSYCFSHSTNKYYIRGNEVYFNPFHSSQYCIFLYKLANSAFYRIENKSIATKIYLLNKMLHSCDLFYEIKLPKVFFLDHPLGAVLGKATYGTHFSFRQGCTVGNNKGIFPVIGDHVKMWSNSKILGNCQIGDNVIISSGSYIKDQNIPDNTIVFGRSPNIILKENKQSGVTS